MNNYLLIHLAGGVANWAAAGPYCQTSIVAYSSSYRWYKRVMIIENDDIMKALLGFTYVC
jgi:hypothetical protein